MCLLVCIVCIVRVYRVVVPRSKGPINIRIHTCSFSNHTSARSAQRRRTQSSSFCVRRSTTSPQGELHVYVANAHSQYGRNAIDLIESANGRRSDRCLSDCQPASQLASQPASQASACLVSMPSVVIYVCVCVSV